MSVNPGLLSDIDWYEERRLDIVLFVVSCFIVKHSSYCYFLGLIFWALFYISIYISILQ